MMEYKKCECCGEIADWDLPGMGRPSLCEWCYGKLIEKYGLKDSPISQKYALVIKRFREENKNEHKNSLFANSKNSQEQENSIKKRVRKSAKDKEIERLKEENAALKRKASLSRTGTNSEARKEVYPVQYTKHVQKGSSRWEIKVKNTAGVPILVFSQPDTVDESYILKCCSRLKKVLYMAIDGDIIKE
jgi:hypothetical protein